MGCDVLGSLSFEPGSRIQSVGASAFLGTVLISDRVQFPDRLMPGGSGYDPGWFGRAGIIIGDLF